MPRDFAGHTIGDGNTDGQWKSQSKEDKAFSLGNASTQTEKIKHMGYVVHATKKKDAKMLLIRHHMYKEIGPVGLR